MWDENLENAQPSETDWSHKS